MFLCVLLTKLAVSVIVTVTFLLSVLFCFFFRFGDFVDKLTWLIHNV